jgi:peroxiredoxin
VNPVPLTEAPALPDDPDDAADHGRIGYGRLGRYSPVLLGLLLLLTVAGIWWAQRDNQSTALSPADALDQPAPDVALTLLDGSALNLRDLRGSVVVLNFWASWCEPCREEMPELQAYWDSGRASGEQNEIVGIGVRTDNEDAARAFVEQGGFTYPIARDTNTDRPGIGPVEAAFGIPPAYPSTIVIRPDGIVDRFHLGPLNREMLRLMIEEARAASG